MRACDLILKKRNGGELSREEIDYLVRGYTAGTIPDYQIAAWAMAVFFRGMTAAEILELTLAMARSGDTINLDEIPGIKVDKHSTGGVGDTTTLVLAPLVAAAGAPVAKMSGRGLGHTGGTLDKLEAVPGMKTDLSRAEMVRAVREIGVAVAGQTGNLVPADKKLYALRDVTATVDSMPLIAASVMSKKLAAGADALVLDVKAGDGAFMKTLDGALALAETMVAIGTGAGRRTVALITNMDQPLGRAVGNALEVEEAILTLQGRGPADLEELCLVLGGHMLCLAGKAADPDTARAALREAIGGGAALAKFRQLLEAQGGDGCVVEDLSLLPRAAFPVPVKAAETGFVRRIKAQDIGLAAMLLGAGRETKEDQIDPAVGVVLEKKVGDRVESGEPLAVLHANSAPSSPAVQEAARLVAGAYRFGAEPVKQPPLLLAYVDRGGITRLQPGERSGEAPGQKNTSRPVEGKKEAAHD